jgi:hypothetical protein
MPPPDGKVPAQGARRDSSPTQGDQLDQKSGLSLQRTAPVEIPAVHRWRSNGHLIAQVAELGYITGLVLDSTYGEAGGFWSVWRPADLVAHDLKVDGVDFLDLPYSPGKFDTIVFDPPYKLNGTPAEAGFDTRYGVDKYQRWQNRIQLMVDGVTALDPFLKPGGHLLVKCMDQVCSGKVRWQTVILTNHTVGLGYELEDRFDLLGHARKQPAGRRQVHARGRGSTLLVFRKAARR